ncbi:MAG: hypothetical protein O2923_14850, partial [Verrucomicrobia bacterium]|nr:hypothetical protein [Verrucomicrobiota bacterium]
LSTNGGEEFFNKGLRVTVKSLQLTNPGIPIVVFHGGLSREQAGMIPDVETILIDDSLYDSSHREDLTRSAFYKLEIHRLARFDRVVYLGSDLVVLDDLSRLTCVDRGLAGVTRPLGLEHEFHYPEQVQASEPALSGDRILNTGVLCFNMSRWADGKLFREALQIADQYGWSFFKNADQGILNILAARHGGVREVPVTYNFCMIPEMGHPVPYPVKRNPSGLLAPYEVGRIQRRLMAMGVPLPFHWGRFVKILHWNGWDKPWRFDERQVPAIERKRSYAECYDQFL